MLLNYLDKTKALVSSLFASMRSFGPNRSVIGLDIDQQGIAALEIVSGPVKPIVKSFAFEKFSSPALSAEALKKVLEKFDTSNADIVLALNDPKTVVDYISLPLMPADELAQAVKLQVSNAQHYALDNPVVDFQMKGRGTEKGIEKSQIMVAAVPKSSLDHLLSKFKSTDSATGQLRKILFLDNLMNLNIRSAIPAACAVENIVKSSPMSQAVAVLYMGGSTTELSVFHGGSLHMSRKINVTAADLVKSLTGAMFSDSGKIELSLPEAQLLQEEHGIPLPGDNFLIRGKITANQALSLLRPKLEQLSREISRCFDYYADRHGNQRVEKILLLGEAVLVKRLNEVLAAELGVAVEAGNPLNGLEAQGATMSVSQAQRLTGAIGAALTDPSKSLNLLPENFRNLEKKFVQRLFVSFLGGLLVVLTILIYMGLFIQHMIVAKQLEAAKREYQMLIPKVEGVKNKLLIEQRMSGRFNMGRLFMQLSHVPENVYFTELDMDQNTVVLSGFVKSEEEGKAQEILQTLMASLAQGLYHPVLDSLKTSLGQNTVSEFVIKASLYPVKENNETAADQK